MQVDMGRQALLWGEVGSSRIHVLENLRNEIRTRSLYPTWGNFKLVEALDLYCQVLRAEEDYFALILVQETYSELIGVISRLEVVYREAYFLLGQSSRAIKGFVGFALQAIMLTSDSFLSRNSAYHKVAFEDSVACQSPNARGVLLRRSISADL